MSYGGRLQNSELGSWFTKIRDGLRLENTLKATTKQVAIVADKVGIKPITQAAQAADKIAGKLVTTIYDLEHNPVVIKVAAVVVAAVLAYFGQASLAASELKAGFAYAKLVQAKNDLKKSKADFDNDMAAADKINALIPFMSDADANAVAAAFNTDGAKSLSTPAIKSLIDKAVAFQKAVMDKIKAMTTDQLNAASLSIDKSGNIVGTNDNLKAIINSVIEAMRPIEAKKEVEAVVSNATNNATSSMTSSPSSFMNAFNNLPIDVKKYLPYAIVIGLVLSRL